MLSHPLFEWNPEPSHEATSSRVDLVRRSDYDWHRVCAPRQSASSLSHFRARCRFLRRPRHGPRIRFCARASPARQRGARSCTRLHRFANYRFGTQCGDPAHHRHHSALRSRWAHREYFDAHSRLCRRTRRRSTRRSLRLRAQRPRCGRRWRRGLRLARNSSRSPRRSPASKRCNLFIYGWRRSWAAWSFCLRC